jgi:hypothetical protein
MSTEMQSIEEMRNEMLLLRAENAKLKANKSTVNGIKVSAKGGVSVYGLGKWPVTLYRSQWESLLAKAEDIRAFILANQAILASKAED